MTTKMPFRANCFFHIPHPCVFFTTNVDIDVVFLCFHVWETRKCPKQLRRRQKYVFTPKMLCIIIHVLIETVIKKVHTKIARSNTLHTLCHQSNRPRSCLDSKLGAILLWARVAWIKPSLRSSPKTEPRARVTAWTHLSMLCPCTGKSGTHIFTSMIFTNSCFGILLVSTGSWLPSVSHWMRSSRVVASMLMVGTLLTLWPVSPNSMSPRIFRICCTANSCCHRKAWFVDLVYVPSVHSMHSFACMGQRCL